MVRLVRPLVLILLALVTAVPASAVQVSIPASKDNTLYELTSGTSSNGAGEYVFTGVTKENVRRRAVIQFDVAAAVPAGATITAVTLQMRVSRVSNNTLRATTLHRLLAAWGEGTSNAAQNEGKGATPTTDDATWIHRFYPGTSWTTPGGDFVGAATATTMVTGTGVYTWSGAAVVADVQGWLNNPATNFGWLIRGQEGLAETAKRFDSSENAQATRQPALIVDFTPPVGVTGACCYGDTCQVVTAATCTSLAGTYQGNGTTCTPDPCPPPPDPTGACCFGNGTCDTLTATQCTVAGGAYQGDGAACTAGLCPLVLTPYVDALPRPAVAVPVVGAPGGAADYLMPIREVSQKLHRDLPPTRVWGYAGSYPGPTIEAGTGAPINVTWWNDLRDSLGILRTTHYLPVDMCMHGPDSAGMTPRVVTHLHGGHVPAAVDGYPDSTLLPSQQVTYTYPNNQAPGTLWYHDHALGITRLNVMMGLAGFYLIRDPLENALGLPAGEYEIPLAIQDRSFRPDGSLVYPEMWMEHFEGDVMLVNGKVWPYLQVKQGKYRFRLLNGCNSRFLRLALSNGAPFTVIGTELGLLPAPVTRDTLLISNGERYDVVIDFSAYPAGTQLVLTNDAPTMFPGTPGEGVIPNVMRFDVVAATGHTAALPGSLRPVPPIDPADAIVSRDFKLSKMSDPCTGSMWMINELHWDDITEFPLLGDTEIWRFVNDSGISHPMHMHLVQFQVLDRQPFTRVGGAIVPTGPAVPPSASESGWKDTAPVAPNEILRVIARFEDYAGLYAYHCHILEHEDHEMMRQFQSVARPAVSVRDTSVVEGDGAVAAFAVTLSAAVPVEVRVLATTEPGTALPGADYSASSDTVVFAPGTTTQLFTVPVVQDALGELDETFTVRLIGRVNASAGDTVAIGTIVDDDGDPLVSIADVVVAEGDADSTIAAFTVTRSGATVKPMWVLYTTLAGTATDGVDFRAIAPAETLYFAPGDTSLTRSIEVTVFGDLEDEIDETFAVRLVSPLNAALADSIGDGTITDDDEVVAVGGGVPALHYLGRSLPNPFADRVTIRWGLSSPAMADLTIYDVQGRRIRRLEHGMVAAGHKSTAWDGRDENGATVAAGIYLVRLQAGTQEYQGKILRLR